MKIIYTLFIALFVTGSAIAQTAFTCSPANSHNAIIALNTYTSHNIDLLNSSTDSLTLGWTLISNDFDTAWDYSLCDYQNCYFSIPSSATMFPIAGTINAFFIISVNPGSTEAIGTIQLWVYDVDNPSDGDTVTFTLESSSAVGISDLSDNNQPLFYPNPANETLIINSNADRVALYNITGEVMMDEINYTQNSKLDVSELPKGIYFVRITQGEKSIAKKLVVQ